MPPDNNCNSKVKLIGACVDLPPGDFEQALNALRKKLDDKELLKALDKLFREESKKLLEHEHSRQVSGSNELPDQETGKRMQSSAQKAFKAFAQKEFSNSFAGRQLQKDADKLTEEFNNSPAGVWVDKNTGLAYFIGAVAILGGVYGIYKTKHDGLGLPLEFIDVKKKIGSITLSGKIASFKPGSGQYEANVGMNQKLTHIKYDLKLSASVSKTGDISQIAEGKMVINLHRKLTVTTSAKSSYSRTKEESTRMVAGYTQSTQFERSLLTADAAMKVEYKDNGYTFQAAASVKGLGLSDSHPGASSRTISISSKVSKSLPRYVLDGAAASIEAKHENSAQSGNVGTIMFNLGKSF